MLRYLPFVAGLALAIGLTLWIDTEPADPPRCSAAEDARQAALRVEREALLETVVAFEAQDEPLGELVDRVAREFRLPLQRVEGAADWQATIRLNLKHPIRLRSALALLNLRAGELAEGQLWIEPVAGGPLAICPAADGPSNSLLTRLSAGGSPDLFAAPLPRLFVAGGREKSLGEIGDLLRLVQKALDHEFFEPQTAGPSPAELNCRKEIEAKLRAPVGASYPLLSDLLAGIARDRKLNFCVRGPAEPLANYHLGSFFASLTVQEALDHLHSTYTWGIEHDVVVLRPMKPIQSGQPIVIDLPPGPIWRVYPVGTHVPSQAWPRQVQGFFCGPWQPRSGVGSG